MNWDIEEDISGKWELAERLTGNSKVPEKALRELFEHVMASIASREEVHIEVSHKMKVWAEVFVKKLSYIKEIYTRAVSDYLLVDYEYIEIEDMIAEHKKRGTISHPMYQPGLYYGYSMVKRDIEKQVSKSIYGLYDECYLDAVTVLNQELHQEQSS